MKKELLNKTECTALRGLAIMGIVIHNYAHWMKGMVNENEFTWNVNNCRRMMEVLSQPDELLPVQLFSFLGHYGVPVFLFLSGYGLVKKYEGSQEEVPLGSFVYRSFTKLFSMLFVAFALYIIVDASMPNPHHYSLSEVVLQLGMIANLMPNPSFYFHPGPFWYFGVTFQLYLVYRLFLYRYRHWGVLLALVVISWGLQMCCANNMVILDWLRYNIIGELLPVCLGVWIARTGFLAELRRRYWALAGVVATILVFVMGNSFRSWLWVPAVVVIALVAVVRCLSESVRRWLVRLGGISAALFLVHPAVRIMFITRYQHDVYTGLLLYLMAAIALACVVQWLISNLRGCQK